MSILPTVIVFVIMALVGRVHAQTQTSLPTGYYSGLSSDSSGSYLTTVSTYGPIYYSNDSGVSWNLSDGAASSTGQYLIAGAITRALVSSDYGQHFTTAVNLTGVAQVAISGTGQYMLSIYSSYKCLAYSNNYGASFMLGLGPNRNGSSCENVAIDTSGTYVVLSVYPQGLWTTNNITDPSAWKLTYETKTSIWAVAFGGTSFYAGYSSSPASVVQSTNYGYNWTVKGSVPDPITSMAVDSRGVNVLITAAAGLYISEASGLYLSQDSGSSFDWIYSGEFYHLAMNDNTTLAIFDGIPANSISLNTNVYIGNPRKKPLFHVCVSLF